jgi:uncharacterized RDD family membrane protein YckC
VTKAQSAAPIMNKMARSFVTPEGVDLRLELGDGSQRAAAFFIDIAIIVGTLTVFTLVLVLAGVGSAGFGGVTWIVVIWLLGSFILRSFYFTAFELSAKAATPGKRALGLRVAARDGGRLPAQAVLARNAMRELEVFLPLSVLFSQTDGGGAEGWMYLLTFVWVCIFVFFPLFNKDRLRPGDLVGGTWVVRTPKQALMRDIAEDAVSDTSGYVFTQEQLDAYGVKELQILEQVLRTRDDDTMKSVTERICAKIGMPYRWDTSDYEFLSAYYAGLRNRLENSLMMGKRRVDKFDV